MFSLPLSELMQQSYLLAYLVSGLDHISRNYYKSVISFL